MDYLPAGALWTIYPPGHESLIHPPGHESLIHPPGHEKLTPEESDGAAQRVILWEKRRE